MAVTSIWSIKGWIGKVINYAENPDKTKEQTNQELISENETGQLQGEYLRINHDPHKDLMM